MKQSEEQREWVASLLLLDYWLLGSAILLFCVGLATIYSHVGVEGQLLRAPICMGIFFGLCLFGDPQDWI